MALVSNPVPPSCDDQASEIEEWRALELRAKGRSVEWIAKALGKPSEWVTELIGAEAKTLRDSGRPQAGWGIGKHQEVTTG